MTFNKQLNHIIWLIDENRYELRTHRSILKRMMPESIEVRTIIAYKNLDDYLPLLNDPQTACIITDQKLKVTGIATYTGIELAEYLRAINTKIPIYILTNFADDSDEFIGGEWSVEDILRKDELSDVSKQKTLTARILRRIGVYEDILGEREEKFHTLLKKSMEGELENSELQELDELRLQKISPNLARELEQVIQMEQIVRAHEELMSRFQYHAQKEDGDVI
ncbi:MAG TPA: hypothetical protein VEP90_05925 [Methylomirabilota bacterium]|nr:hypothetical protein [Methylomirabilota bacterium]